MMKLNFVDITQKQRNAMEEIKDMLGIEIEEDGILIETEKISDIIEITAHDSGIKIKYAQDSQLIRAVGLLVEKLKEEKEFYIIEKPNYERLGIMVDCSRNAVINMKSFQKLVKHIALMGYNSIQLYMEDTFEMENYPYFGYLRGRYSKKELMDMDNYASLFTIELIPAIQTLAHLKQALKWNTMKELVDYDDILLIDDDRTYQFIDDMFKNLTECFASKRINIGMDEAHMVGLGKYLDKHGYVNRTELMIKHFEKVMELARKYELQPMMWSDMFFRLINGGEYYATDTTLDPEILKKIPQDVGMIYWDYYSEKSEIYDSMLEKHQEMSSNVIFAGGAWKWVGYSPNNHFSEKVGLIAHESCKKNNINEVLITMWGDNGAECSPFSVLPTLMLWAELCYKDNCSDEYMKKRFYTCTQMDYDDFMNLDMLMLTPDNPSPGAISGNLLNPPKYIFYQDILLGLFDKHIDVNTYKDHFHSCAEAFVIMKERNGEYNYIFETQYLMSKILEIKCNAGIDIRSAYKEKNMDKLQYYTNTVLPQLIDYITKFTLVYRNEWLLENKIFGIEIIEIRIGGLIQRIKFAIDRITAFLDKKVDIIDELEETMLYFDGRIQGEHGAICEPLWHNIVTPSIISHV